MKSKVWFFSNVGTSQLAKKLESEKPLGILKLALISEVSTKAHHKGGEQATWGPGRNHLPVGPTDKKQLNQVEVP